jgi:hypothetical protein
MSPAALRAGLLTHYPQRWSVSAAPHAMNSRPLARALADAMLAGPPAPAAVAARCAVALGRRWRWLRGLADAMVALHSRRWVPTARDTVAESILAHPAFRRAQARDDRPRVRSYFILRPAMGPRPDALEQCALPDLATPLDLAHWLGLTFEELEWLTRARTPWARGAGASPGAEAVAVSSHYAYRWVEKRSGGWRLIEMPKARLRSAQRKLLRGLLEYIPPHEAAHGFRTRHSILTHALAHVGQRVVLRMDLKNFFLTLGGARIRALFSTLGYPQAVAGMLAALCTNCVPVGILTPIRPGRYDFELPDVDWLTRKRYASPHLPQGAPTSPALANLCAFRLDLRLQSAAEKFHAAYTRYADDLVFSGGEALLRGMERFVPLVGAIALEEGLQVNFRKTRVMTRARRQQVTGVVVNEKANLRRDAYDRLKATLHNCARLGPRTQNRAGLADFRAHLAGRVAHAAMLNPARGARLRGLFDSINWDGG